jgi:predicted nucleotidyltransferase
VLSDPVDQFLKEFTDWARSQPDIRAVGLVGSYARGAATPESDVDLVLLARQPGQYLNNTGWARRFGPIRDQRVEDYGRLTSLRVWYADGLEVEYGLTDLTWAAPPLDAGTARVIADGLRVLFEREPLLSPFTSRPRRPDL